MRTRAISVVLFCIISCFVYDAAFGYEFREFPPDSIGQEPLPSQSLYHLYGTEEGELDVDSLYPWFDKVFNLYVTDQVGDWDTSDIEDMILLIMDEDSTNSADIFPQVWDYFCYSDLDTTYAGVSFTTAGDSARTDIDLYVYDSIDVASYCPGEYECDGNNRQLWKTNDILLNATDGADALEAIVIVAFSHELQHLCYQANGMARFYWDYNGLNESLSMCAENLVGAYELHTNTSPKKVDVSYDASIWGGEQCDPNYKIFVWMVWMGYLVWVFDNETPSNIKDDLVYNWIRSQDKELTMNSLANVLEGNNYSWLGENSTGDERLQNLFQYFSVAKFCNAPNFDANGRFGFDGTFSPVIHPRLFFDVCDWYPTGAKPMLDVDCPDPGTPCGHDDPCGGCWNVRILPPVYELGSSSEDVMTKVDGIYIEESDSSRDYIDVATYGTDYIIFQADNYYQDGDSHELHFYLAGESSTPPSNSEVKMWIIGYDSTEDSLQTHPEDLVFIEPATIDSDSTKGYVVVTGFGSTIKSVVVAITLVEEVASGTTSINYFTYEYQYGVYSSDGADVTWKGDVFMMGDVELGVTASLTIEAGTKIRVYDDGIPTTSVVLDVDGQLDVNGTSSNRVTFEPLDDNAEAGDWMGILFSTGTSGASSISYCDIKKAYHGIKTYSDIEISNCNITDSEVYGIYVYGSSTYQYANGTEISYCKVNDNGSAGIYVYDTDTVSIADCEASNNYYGVKIYKSDYVTIDTIDVKFNDYDGIKAIYSDYYDFDWCYADSNGQHGIYFSHASSGYVTKSRMKGNDGNGMLCTGNLSNPFIDHSKISDNGAAGIRANSSAYPVLGYIPFDIGQDNSIINDIPRVYNNTSDTLDAENCWWGVAPPYQIFFIGAVDYNPYLTGDPVPYLAPRLNNKTILALAQNYPNPFMGGTTTINYSIPNSKERVSLRIYDVSGRRVRTLVDKVQTTGQYKVKWDGRNDRGINVAPGVYFYQLRVGDKALSKRIILVR